MTVTVTSDTLRGWPLPAPDASEKHSRGVVLVVAGSAQTPGAARLAAEAALRTGCGKVRIATVASVAAQLGALVPEARVYGCAETAAGDLSAGSAPQIAAIAASADATLIGPGLVDPDEAAALVGALAPALPGPVVLDALATAYVDTHRDLRDLRGPCVLTMNPAELAQVLSRDAAALADDPTAALAALVESSGAVVLLGGQRKWVASPDGPVHVVDAGGPGLATAGSGDVQAGLVAGLLARGADPAQAAVWGAWLHGTAGDRLAGRAGSLGFLARDLSPEVPALIDALVDAPGR